jgi:dipeptidyl aminopeptidase/acylaminoacyl peptidase
MFQKIYLVPLKEKTKTLVFTPPGKMGVYAFSPDGSRLAVAASKERSDHAVSQAYVLPLRGGPSVNVTPKSFRGHVNWVGWRDDATLLFRAGEGVQTTLSTVKLDGTDRQILLSSRNQSGSETPIARAMKGGIRWSVIDASGTLHWAPGKEVERLTTVSSELRATSLGAQGLIRYKARDGMEIEGLLIYPVGYVKGKKYPLIVVVHGGPESHYSNGWLTSYGEPGQVLAGKGYAVFYPNLRGQHRVRGGVCRAGSGRPRREGIR